MENPNSRSNRNNRGRGRGKQQQRDVSRETAVSPQQQKKKVKGKVEVENDRDDKNDSTDITLPFSLDTVVLPNRQEFIWWKLRVDNQINTIRDKFEDLVDVQNSITHDFVDIRAEVDFLLKGKDDSDELKKRKNKMFRKETRREMVDLKEEIKKLKENKVEGERVENFVDNDEKEMWKKEIEKLREEMKEENERLREEIDDMRVELKNLRNEKYFEELKK